MTTIQTSHVIDPRRPVNAKSLTEVLARSIALAPAFDVPLIVAAPGLALASPFAHIEPPVFRTLVALAYASVALVLASLALASAAVFLAHAAHGFVLAVACDLAVAPAVLATAAPASLVDF